MFLSHFYLVLMHIFFGMLHIHCNVVLNHDYCLDSATWSGRSSYTAANATDTDVSTARPERSDATGILPLVVMTGCDTCHVTDFK